MSDTDRRHSLFIDGGARGNPGPAAAGWVLKDPAGKKIERRNRYLGAATNNVAEYEALCAGLSGAAAGKIISLTVYSDSELLVRQMNGEYRTKNAALKSLQAKIHVLMAKIPDVRFVYIRRELNKEADALVNLALDEHI